MWGGRVPGPCRGDRLGPFCRQNHDCEGPTIDLKSRVRVRFAPSPTGSLHIGSARTALFNYLLARHAGGVFVLRIDDTDVARSEDRHEDAILRDLRWLGLAWDEGPGAAGDYGPYRQSERLERYRGAAGELLASGAAYRCFCTQERLDELRAQALAEGRPPRYDRRCLHLPADEVAARLAAGEPAAVRFLVPSGEVVIDDALRGPVQLGEGAVGDFIIVRSEGAASYNFATAVDDRDMAITHVVRGDDHLTNTARQLLLLRALGAEPPRYAHHGMILGPDGRKLSKRHGATAVGDFRELGFLPEAVVNYLALLSWSHGEDEVLDMTRLVADFELEKLGTSAAIFDQAKMDWLDHEHIMALAPQTHERLFAERLPAGTAPQAAAALAAAFQPSLVAYGQAPALAAAVLDPPPPLPAELAAIVSAGAPQLERFAALRAGATEWLAPAAAHELLAAYRAWGKERGIGARKLLMPLRLALTGREHGPELHFVLAALAREQATGRIGAALRAASPAADDPDATGRPADPRVAADDHTTQGDAP
jgi:nondiscriminating glutamyl-tRNA synthetase